jgi:hypothetical protein
MCAQGSSGLRSGQDRALLLPAQGRGLAAVPTAQRVAAPDGEQGDEEDGEFCGSFFNAMLGVPVAVLAGSGPRTKDAEDRLKAEEEEHGSLSSLAGIGGYCTGRAKADAGSGPCRQG